MSDLVLDHVSVALGGRLVVRDVSAEIGAGAWVAVIGPNGGGKTSLLRAVCGLVAYDGSIAVSGSEARELPRHELARRVAFVPQQPLIPEEMSVSDYVLLGRTPHLRYLGAEGPRDVDAAVAALERLDLLALAHRRLGTLSGGERQRAVLARALAQEAPLLLLDEPTAALDVGRQQQVLELVDALRREHALTVVSAMHDLTLVGQFAERLLLIDDGRVVAAGAPAAVLTEELLAAHYDARVRVVADPDLGVLVVPTRGERVAGPRG